MTPYSLKIKKTGSDTTVDTYSTYNIVCKSIPLQLFPETKDLPSNDWKDQDGDDTYIPSMSYYKAYDLDIEWVYKGSITGTSSEYKWDANDYIQSFLDFLSGKSDGIVSMSIIDLYTQIQVDDVYFKGASEDAFYRIFGDEEIVTFKTTMRVTNPIYTNIDSTGLER